MTRPNFIVIGPGKTGTTWLYKCLKEHPEIRLARGTKETLFFNHNYHKGLRWYERFFEGFDGVPAVGEISNDYFFSEEAPARIAESLPNVKLITLLRNPVERIISMYQFNLRNGNFRQWHGEEQVTLAETLVSVPAMVEKNCYQKYLENYLRHFPRERIFVGLYDDVKASPEKLLTDIYTFLGVDPAFVAPSQTKRVLPASEARFGNSLHLAKRVGHWLREHDLHAVLTWAKTNPVLLKVLTKPVTRTVAVPEETRQRLREVFDPHTRYVERLVGRNLEHWR